LYCQIKKIISFYHHDGSKLERDRGATDGGLVVGLGGGLLVEDNLGKRVVDVGELFGQLRILLLGLIQVLGWDVDNLALLAAGALKVVCLHRDQVDDALKGALDAHGHLDGGSVQVQLGTDLVNDPPGICANTVVMFTLFLMYKRNPSTHRSSLLIKQMRGTL